MSWPTLLDKPEGQGLLTLEEQVQVPFLAADCLFDLGEYATALAAYRPWPIATPAGWKG